MNSMIEKESRRILIQTDQSDWANATPEIRDAFIHKSLLQKSNRFLHHILQSLDNAVSDIRYGYWRDTILHQKHISQFVLCLRADLMRMKFSSLRRLSSKNEGCHSNDAILVGHSLFVVRPHGRILKKHTPFNFDGLQKRSRSIPSIFPTQDLLPPSWWLSASDSAEASFEDDITGKSFCVT